MNIQLVEFFRPNIFLVAKTFMSFITFCKEVSSVYRFFTLFFLCIQNFKFGMVFNFIFLLNLILQLKLTETACSLLLMFANDSRLVYLSTCSG